MKIVVIGAGFTGLSAAYRLLQAGHDVTILERESVLGGLATGYKHRGWKWHLDKAYHHLFTNDDSAIALAKEIGQKLWRITPQTCVMAQGQIIPFDSPRTLLTFPHLGPVDKLRTGMILMYLKMVNEYKWMKSVRATEWIKKYMGIASYRAIWEPLFRGKFGDQADSVMLPWFWARIKKRTQSLLYPEGGFTAFLERLAHHIARLGGTIHLNTPVQKVQRKGGGYSVVTEGHKLGADKILYTGPTFLFPRLFGQPLKPARKPHEYLSAQILVLRLKKAFLSGDTYWLNVTDPGFPFLVLVDHTNSVSPRHYGDEHIVYAGNYLPPEHPYLQMSKRQLLKLFDPFLARIKSGYKKDLLGADLFTLPYAQAVVNKDYVSNMAKSGTGLPGVYMANIDSVYPWDRGTNYAIETGEKLAKIIQSE